MSEQHPGSAGDQNIQPPPGQGFPPPPLYPDHQGEAVPGGQPGGYQPTTPGYQPGPAPSPGYQQGYGQPPGYQPGPNPAGGYPSAPNPGYPTGQTPPPGYPSGQTPAPGYGQNPAAGYPSGATPAAGYGQAPGYQPIGQQQYPGGYQSQGGYPGSGYQADYLGSQNIAPTPTRRKGRRGLWVAVSAGTVVILGAASVGAYTLLSGGGTTLDKKVPADAVAYAEVNLDPPAGQKVAALRYLKHFPSLKVQDNANTLLDGLLENIFPNPADRQRFSNDVQPWLGKHAAVAGDPQGGAIKPVVVLEATDTGKAKSGLADLAKEQHFGFVVGDGTVTIAETQDIAQQAADGAAKSSLSGTSTYQNDVKAVGGDGGVITGWASFDAAAKYIPAQAGQANLDSLKGARLAMSLKFTDTVADLTVKTFGGKTPQAPGTVGAKVGKLPDDTAVAVGISGGDQLIRTAYQALQKAGFSNEIESALGKYDLQLPDDLATLVGSQTVVAVGGSGSDIQAGVITKTDNPSRAREVAEKLLTDVGNSDVTIVQQQTSDGLALASSQDYLTKLTSGGGLGNSDAYRQAVPDANSAQDLIYVDVQRAFGLSGGTAVPASVRPLKAIGLTASATSDGSTAHIRLVVG